MLFVQIQIFSYFNQHLEAKQSESFIGIVSKFQNCLSNRITISKKNIYYFYNSNVFVLFLKQTD